VKRSLSLPARFVLLVLLVVVVPLGVMGYWLAFSAARSGEDLLRSRLEQTNARVAAEIAGRWLGQRSQLLDFADDEAVQLALASGPAAAPTGEGGPPPPALLARIDSLPVEVTELALRDRNGQIVWHSVRSQAAVPTFGVTLPVSARRGGHAIGTLEARLPGRAVLNDDSGRGSTVGAVVAVIDPAEGASLRGLPFDPSLLESERFTWDEQAWVAARRTLRDPHLLVISAAPLAEFATPFESAGRRGLGILFAVAVAATALAALISRRMTRSLAQLAVAADSVSRGDLRVRVPEERLDEVGRVASAFNRMAERLEGTLSELAHREGLAAVGSFASELAHEVRNPLTSIKVDLQYVEEQLPEGTEIKDVQRSAVSAVDRLDRTVTGVLQIARSGQIVWESLDLREPVRAASDALESIARQAGVQLQVRMPDGTVVVLGDRDALQRLFTNVLANAVQASARGDVITVTLGCAGDEVGVTVRDHGAGIPPHRLSRIREPFFSTRPEGTGLGLAIAGRIAAAHQAELEIESEVGVGTSVKVRFRTNLATNPVDLSVSRADTLDAGSVTRHPNPPRPPDATQHDRR
jgi:signal transduction histidine kinase